jgi:hypothetical protein
MKILKMFKCFFGIHKWVNVRLRVFYDPKMDSYGNVSEVLQVRHCSICHKNSYKAI